MICIYMTIKNKQDPFLLFLGDIVAFFISLWLTLLLRYGNVPTANVWAVHVYPFSVIFLISAIVFLIAGLYEKHTTHIRTQLLSNLVYAQVSNALIAIAFFYFIPFFGINPKTNLFLYLIISTL